jgi:hypothetical protein
MGKLGFTAIFVMMCGLFGALDATSGAATLAAAPIAAVAPEDASCDAAAAAEDALTCSGDGWIATLTCCGNGTERWTRNGQTKCCGPCFLP